MVCLGFEPGPQDGRRRRNHGAMAATPPILSYPPSLSLNKSHIVTSIITHTLEHTNCPPISLTLAVPLLFCYNSKKIQKFRFFGGK